MMHFGVLPVVFVVLLGFGTAGATTYGNLTQETSVEDELSDFVNTTFRNVTLSTSTVDAISDFDNTTFRNVTLGTSTAGAISELGNATFRNVTVETSTVDIISDFSNSSDNTTKQDLTGSKQNHSLDYKEYTLPEAWGPFCKVSTETYESRFTNLTKLISVQCNINQTYSGVWSMAVLRESLNNYNDSAEKFAFDIKCMNNARIFLFWPVKVNNLVKLQVKGCLLVDFLSEHDSELIKRIPDSLKVLEMFNNQILISVKRFIKILKNVKDTPEEYTCGHQTTVERLTIRDVSYEFLEPPETNHKNLLEIGEQFLLDSQRITYKCDYKRLMYLDESKSNSMSLYHASLLAELTIYHELRTYNLSYNHINTLKVAQLEWSRYFPKLELYDLSHNDISELYWFEIPLHQRLHQITTINLQYNNITTITVKDLERFKMMPMVLFDLRNNPLYCNCTEPFKELLNFVHMELYRNISNLTDYSYIKDLRCAAPESVMGRTLASLGVNDLPCDKVIITESETEYFVVPLVTMSVAVLLLTIILLLLLKYRKEVLILLYTRFHIIVPCQSGTWFDDKHYDAFVSYSSNDEEFVESFFEKLEQPSEEANTKTFKFCLHHRDFVLGKTIFSNICNSVENSRHTIILLSKSFINSQFCVYEFQEAFRQSIMEKKRHLIIVMMEDVPTEELPKDLKRCIKTFTYIRKDDYLFSDRLIYALSVKQKSKRVKENESENVTTKDIGPKTKTKKSKKPNLKIEATGVLNQNFIHDLNEKDNRENCIVAKEISKTNTADIDYDRLISTGSADTGYNSDFIPSPASTVCSSPTYGIPDTCNRIIETVA